MSRWCQIQNLNEPGGAYDPHAADLGDRLHARIAGHQIISLAKDGVGKEVVILAVASNLGQWLAEFWNELGYFDENPDQVLDLML